MAKRTERFPCSLGEHQKKSTDHNCPSEDISNQWIQRYQGEADFFLQKEVMGQQKQRHQDRTDMKTEEDHGHKRLLAPAVGAKGNQPLDNRLQSPFEPLGRIGLVGYAVHLPVQSPEIENKPDKHTDQTNAQRQPKHRAG